MEILVFRRIWNFSVQFYPAEKLKFYKNQKDRKEREPNWAQNEQQCYFAFLYFMIEFFETRLYNFVTII